MRKYKKIERKTLKDDFSKTYGNKKRSRINLGGNILIAPVLNMKTHFSRAQEQESEYSNEDTYAFLKV